MGLFGDIKGQRSTMGGHYFIPDAHYVVEIQRCKTGKTRKNVDFFVVECLIRETDSDKMRPGAPGEMMVTLDKDPALGNIADFMRMGLWIQGRDAEVDGLPPSAEDVEMDEDIADEVVGENNPLAGLVMGVYAYNKDTKAGNPFTRHRWMTSEEARTKIQVAKVAQATQVAQAAQAAS
ncbi:hypothetical protein LCGC14_0630810 [marine sediment metagenome]|uniref:Uncharacterized protein n=1 Tax=marine sediment metagenome TaxID=412755 RepID=A0A0F9R7A8_9ZZZZ